VFEVGATAGTSRFGFAPHYDSAKLALEVNAADAVDEALPVSTGDVLDDKAVFEQQNPLPEEEDPAASSAYHLSSALVISSLMTFALF
jgi:hypothetical protein